MVTWRHFFKQIISDSVPWGDLGSCFGDVTVYILDDALFSRLTVDNHHSLIWLQWLSHKGRCLFRFFLIKHVEVALLSFFSGCIWHYNNSHSIFKSFWFQQLNWKTSFTKFVVSFRSCTGKLRLQVLELILTDHFSTLLSNLVCCPWIFNFHNDLRSAVLFWLWCFK
jgi:hypothetical protein